MTIDFAHADVREPSLTLKNADGVNIGFLGRAFNIKGEFYYNEVSKITFDLPSFADGEATPAYKDVIGMRIVELEGYGNFILVNSQITSDGIREIKQCTAYSLEYELSYKNISVPKNTYKFYNILNPKDPNTVIGMILEVAPDWSAGEIDTDVALKYRTFEEDEIGVYDFIKNTLQEKFHCVFNFDTYKRTISVKSAADDPKTNAVYISHDNLAKAIELEEDTEGIFTVMDVRGDDDVDIRGVNPTGTNKIYNLDYFMNTTNFSENIINKWNRWKTEVDGYRQQYYNIGIDRATETAKKATEQAKLTTLEGELTEYDSLRAVKIQRQQTENAESARHTQEELDELNAQIKAKKEEIAAQQEKISETDKKISELTGRLKDVNDLVSLESYFTKDEYSSISKYFKEGSIQESSFTTTNISAFGTSENETDNLSVNSMLFSLKSSHKTIAKNDVFRIDDKSYQTDAKGNLNFQRITGGKVEISYKAPEDKPDRYIQNIESDVLEAVIKRTGSETDGDKITITILLGAGKTTFAVKNKDTENPEEEWATETKEFPKATYTLTAKECQMLYDLAGGFVTLSFGSDAETTSYFTRDASETERQSVQWNLYEYGENCLAKLAYPSYTFSVDVANFFALEDFVKFKNSIQLGEKIYLQIDGTTLLQPILTEVDLDFEDPTKLVLKFGDKYSSSDNVFALADLLGQSVSMGRKVDYNKFLYSAFTDSGAQTEVDAFMQSALDVAKNAVMSSEGQAVSWDKAGLHLRKFADEPQGGEMFDPEQIWAINNCIVMTDDNWNTAKMAIGKFYFDETGTVVWGVAAPALVGKMLIGSELVIECRSEDGEDILFRVDQNGALLYNAKFDIIAKGKDGCENHIALNPDIGIAIGKNPVYEANADGSYTFNEGNAVFYVDIKTGDIVAKGNIHAKTLYLSKTGGSDIIAYIDKKKGSYSVNPSSGSSVDDDSAEYKILGNYIEGRGLKAYDEAGNLRVHIDGNDGALHMYDGYIEMQNSNGNELTINPTNFIKWKINGEDKFYYDPDAVVTKKGNKTETGALVFRGLLKADSLSVVMGDRDETWLRIDSAGITGDRVKFDAGSRTIDMRCGSLMVNGTTVVTTEDLTTELSAELSSLELRIKQWADSTFAKNTPII